MEFSRSQLTQFSNLFKNICNTKELYRQHLQQLVLFTEDNIDLSIQAVNGHQASWLNIKIEDKIPTKFVEKKFFMNSVSHAALEALLKADKSAGFCARFRETETDSIELLINETPIFIHTKQAQDMFPDLERVKPRYEEDKVIHFSLNPELIYKQWKAMRSKTKDTHMIFSIEPNTLKPVTVELNNESGLIMPMRIG